SYCIWFVIIFNQSSVAVLKIFAYIIQQDLFEKSSNLKTIIRSRPIYLVLKTFNHAGRQFHLAVAYYAPFQIIDVSGFNRKTLQIINGWHGIEPANFQNRRIALSNHALPKRLKKDFRRNLQVNQ